jgi:hypothetical protein
VVVTVGPDELRIGRREREAAVRLLAAHLTEGRLETGEYEHRVETTLGARTRGDLRAIFADLPPPGSAGFRTGLVSERMPEALRTELASDGLLLFDEGLRGSITYHQFRQPGQYTGWGREWVTGTVALTWRRIVVWAARAKRVDLPFDHPLRAAVTLSVEKGGVLCIESDVGAFNPERSGRIIYRLRSTWADTICDLFGSA